MLYNVYIVWFNCTYLFTNKSVLDNLLCSIDLAPQLQLVQLSKGVARSHLKEMFMQQYFTLYRFLTFFS